nr:hypothetical protein [Tanacetum cinerariifolium]
MNRIREEADAVRSCIAQTTAVIAGPQAIEDQDEVHDNLLAAKDAKRGEKSKLLALHEVIVETLEEIERQGHNVAMLDAYVALYTDHELFRLMHECVALETAVTKGKGFLTMAALYIIDKLSEVANSSRLEDKMKVVFSQARDSEALGQRADVLKSLKHMREMVTRDSARVGILEQLLVGAHVGMRLKAEVGILEQLLAGAHVGMRLKAEYAADIGETV